MIFQQDKDIVKEVGIKVGFIFGYFLFTTIIYFVFLTLKKLPDNWNYFNIIGVTIGITVIGTVLRKILR